MPWQNISVPYVSQALAQCVRAIDRCAHQGLAARLEMEKGCATWLLVHLMQYCCHTECCKQRRAYLACPSATESASLGCNAAKYSCPQISQLRLHRSRHHCSRHSRCTQALLPVQPQGETKRSASSLLRQILHSPGVACSTSACCSRPSCCSVSGSSGPDMPTCIDEQCVAEKELRCRFALPYPCAGEDERAGNLFRDPDQVFPACEFCHLNGT